MVLTAIASTSTLPIVRTDSQLWNQNKNISSGLKPCFKFLPFERKTPKIHAIRVKHTSFICAAALNARCAEGQGQTQTVERPTSTITVAPVQGKSPDLDNGGDGFPPYDGGDGGGGGGGGGNWSGGFSFFCFLAFLGFLKDKESEGPYRDERRR